MARSWNNLIASLPGAHFLQTTQWAEIKRNAGWTPVFLCWVKKGFQVEMVEWKDELESIEAAALVLERPFIRLKFSPTLRMQYAPKGPMLDWDDGLLAVQVLDDLVRFSRSRNSIFIKIDPDLAIGGLVETGSLTSDLLASKHAKSLEESGWQFSKEQIQFRNTFRIDLSPDIGDLLSKMKQKTRYNIRMAEKKGIIVRKGSSDDLELLYDMYLKTSIRDGFIIREPAYYYFTWEKFIQSMMADVLIAEYNSDAIAAIFLIHFASKTWFVYGMSTDLHREKMPNYLLQWEAIKSAKQKSCMVYDFWGAPNEITEQDPLWGVYRFKEGFAGEFVRTIGAWDYPNKKLAYTGFVYIYPILLNLMKYGNTNNLRDYGKS